MSSLRSSALPGTFGSGSLASWMVSRGSTDSAASATAAVPAAMPAAGCAISVPTVNASTPSGRGGAGRDERW